MRLAAILLFYHIQHAPSTLRLRIHVRYVEEDTHNGDTISDNVFEKKATVQYWFWPRSSPVWGCTLQETQCWQTTKQKTMNK